MGSYCPAELIGTLLDARTLPQVSPAVSRDDEGRRRLRVGAKGLITRQNRVLLVRERHADGSAFWTIPGGGVEETESLPDCLRREIEEEMRSQSVVRRFVDGFVYRHSSRLTTTIYAVFDATLRTEPESNPAERLFDHAWRTPTNLPSETINPVVDVIQRVMTDSGRG
jgi:8-oxo-dGTP diphosphatase